MQRTILSFSKKLRAELRLKQLKEEGLEMKENKTSIWRIRVLLLKKSFKTEYKMPEISNRRNSVLKVIYHNI